MLMEWFYSPQSQPHVMHDNNDGKMLLEMGIGKRVHQMDCIALDGGCTQYIGDLLEKEKDLSDCNFCFPI
jgi:hypothetical protein